jgi:hypothetical protein
VTGMATRSRVRFGGDTGRSMADLREAVSELCTEIYRSHFKTDPELGSLRVDAQSLERAYADQLARRSKAKPAFERILGEVKIIENLRKQELVSDDALGFAESIGRLVGHFLSGFELQPGRPIWLRSRVRRFYGTEEIPLQVLTAMALLSGWWPEAVTEQKLQEKTFSPSGVFRIESKSIKKALRENHAREADLAADPRVHKLMRALGVPEQSEPGTGTPHTTA